MWVQGFVLRVQVWGLRLRSWVLGFGAEFRVESLGLRVEGSGLTVWVQSLGFGFRVWGWLRV